MSAQKLTDLISQKMVADPRQNYYLFALWYGITGQPLAGLGFSGPVAHQGYRVGQRLAALHGQIPVQA